MKVPFGFRRGEQPLAGAMVRGCGSTAPKARLTVFTVVCESSAAHTVRRFAYCWLIEIGLQPQSIVVKLVDQHHVEIHFGIRASRNAKSQLKELAALIPANTESIPFDSEPLTCTSDGWSHGFHGQRGLLCDGGQDCLARPPRT